MDNRSKVKFSSLYKIPSRNGVYVTKENHGFGISIINMGELFSHEFIQHGEGAYVNLSQKEKSQSCLKNGDLLFGRRSLVESGAGKSSIVINPTEEMTFESSVIRVRLDKEQCNPLYYYYWFKSGTGRSAIRTLVTGSNIKGIKGSDLGNLEVTCIPITEQNVVANLLYSIDLKILNNSSICSDLESMAKLLYDYWFVQFDFPDENGKPYKSSGGKMVWNEQLKREIPEEWDVKMISEIAKIEATTVLPLPGIMYHHYSIPAFDENGLPAEESGEYINSNKYLVPNNTILVSKLNPKFKRIWVISDSDDRSICSTEFIPFVSTDGRKEYLYSLLNSDAFYTYMVQCSSSSTGSRTRMDPELCLRFLFAFPKDSALVDQYCNIIAPMLSKIGALKDENEQLCSLRDFLLPMLMNGQVKVRV